jgi:hypothetical protein
MLRFLSSLLLAAPLCAQTNLLSFIARPCPSNITAPQVHMVLPINVGGISIPFLICASLGPNLSLDTSGPVPILNASGGGGSAPIPGFGLISDSAGHLALNTAVALTIPTERSGAPIFCDSKSGTAVYSCSHTSTAALPAYSTGMFVLLRVNASNTEACTLNIDDLGPKSIKQKDGVTDPAPGQIIPGQFYWAFYDGTVFRLQ